MRVILIWAPLLLINRHLPKGQRLLPVIWSVVGLVYLFQGEFVAASIYFVAAGILLCIKSRPMVALGRLIYKPLKPVLAYKLFGRASVGSTLLAALLGFILLSFALLIILSAFQNPRETFLVTLGIVGLIVLVSALYWLTERRSDKRYYSYSQYASRPSKGTPTLQIVGQSLMARKRKICPFINLPGQKS